MALIPRAIRICGLGLLTVLAACAHVPQPPRPPRPPGATSSLVLGLRNLLGPNYHWTVIEDALDTRAMDWMLEPKDVWQRQEEVELMRVDLPPGEHDVTVHVQLRREDAAAGPPVWAVDEWRGKQTHVRATADASVVQVDSNYRIHIPEGRVEGVAVDVLPLPGPAGGLRPGLRYVVWFLHVDPDAPLPRWSEVQEPGTRR